MCSKHTMTAAAFEASDLLYPKFHSCSFLSGEIGMKKCKVAAKANPWHKEDGSHDFFTPTYGLQPGLVKKQLRKSIEVLG